MRLNLTAQDLPQILKEYRNRGIKVKRVTGKGWSLDGKILTSREILNHYQFGVY